jgi:hypothetical protein
MSGEAVDRAAADGSGAASERAAGDSGGERDQVTMYTTSTPNAAYTESMVILMGINHHTPPWCRLGTWSEVA